MSSRNDVTLASARVEQLREEARLKRVHHVQRLVQFVLEKIHD